MVVVSDTSPIANLILIGQLDLLREMFQEVVIPPAVHREVEALANFGVDLTSYLSNQWIREATPNPSEDVQVLLKDLDLGESEAIVLAKELKADYLLIDERAGTERAIKEGISTIGLVGVLVKAKQRSLIPQLEPVLIKLKDEAGFWLGKKFMESVLKEVGER